jgi:Cu/Ag efflux pump CusA
MWIVRLALRRPYSFTVMAILIVPVGVVTITRMSTDIFPNINIAVVSQNLEARSLNQVRPGESKHAGGTKSYG